MANMTLPEAYKASVAYAENQKNQFTDAVESTFTNLGSNIAQLGVDLLGNAPGEDLIKLADAGADLASRYLQAKIQSILDGFKNKTSVEIRALVGEVSPYVQSPKEASQALKKKITKLLETLGPGGSFWTNLGNDFLTFATNDGGLQDALANLTAVKVFADSLNTASDLIDDLKRMFHIVEPLIPILEITADLFLSLRTQSPANAQKSEAEIKEEIHKWTQELTTLLLGSFRKYVYSLRVDIPNIVLGAINTVSVRDAVLEQDWSNGWLSAVFDEDFYDKTVYSYTWEDSWNKTIRETLGSHEDLIKKWENFDFVDYEGNSITRGEFMKSKFMTTFTQNFMKQAVATARKDARIRIHSEQEWVKFSRNSERVNNYDESEEDEILSFKDFIKKSNFEGTSPFTDVQSIRTLSGQILERYV